jgi:hypothetical protein
MGPDAAIDRRQEIGTPERLARLSLVVLLSPVILIVLAIGLVGMLAQKLGGRPVAMVAVEGVKVTVEGDHLAHDPNRPLGLARMPTQVRELV